MEVFFYIESYSKEFITLHRYVRYIATVILSNKRIEKMSKQTN